MSGKGSKQRPGTGYADGWDRVFAKPAPVDLNLTNSLHAHALDYRSASTQDAHRCYLELEACVNRLIERGEKV